MLNDTHHKPYYNDIITTTC